MKLLIYHPLRLLDALLQLIVPVRRRRVCYMTSPDYTDNAYYVYRHLLETRNDIEHVWLINSNYGLVPRIYAEFDRDVARAGSHGHTLQVLPKYSLAGYFMYLRSSCCFHTHGGYPFSTVAMRRNNVSLWHGMPIKCIGRLNKISPNPFRTFGGTHIATSWFFKYIIAAAFAAAPEDVLVCSLPRCDVLNQSGKLTTGRETIHELLQVPAGRRLVLWMPTYRTETLPKGRAHEKPRSFLDDLPVGILAALDRVCAAQNCTLIAKLHPGDLLNHVETKLDVKHIRLLKASDWLRYEVQLYDLIAASDALISDVSSVLIDYLVTGRPIGILGFDAATYTRDLTFPMQYLLNSRRFRVLDEPEAIESFFSDVVSGNQSTAERNDVAELFYESFPERGAEAVLRAVGLY